MSRCPRIESARLWLRPFAEDDLDAYTAVLQSEPVRMSLHLPGTVGRWEAWSQMAAWLGQWELRGTGQWALEEKATGAFVGRAGLHHPGREDWPGVEIGWTLHPDFWGRGYATEAGRRAVEYAFGELDLAEVCSVILPENSRSIAVARRLGFTLREERILSHAPAMSHGIWWLSRAESVQRSDEERSAGPLSGG
jgi:ribosomal-protein-alanine N-acetyltransferase